MVGAGAETETKAGTELAAVSADLRDVPMCLLPTTYYLLLSTYYLPSLLSCAVALPGTNLASRTQHQSQHACSL
jgi:hypothetical protein